MNFSLGQFVIGVGHVCGWVCMAVGVVMVAAGLVRGHTDTAVIGAMVVGGAVSALILATMASAQLLMAESILAMHQKMASDALAQKSGKVAPTEKPMWG